MIEHSLHIHPLFVNEPLICYDNLDAGNILRGVHPCYAHISKYIFSQSYPIKAFIGSFFF
jgi:hypothetical protein